MMRSLIPWIGAAFMLTGSASSEAGQPSEAAGKVRWHASPEKALDAAAKSGRPVLLFHLLGRLDDGFS